MKQYKYRGWPQLALTVMFVGIYVYNIIVSQHKAITAFLYIPQLFIPIPLFIQQRRLTEKQWKAQQNNRDERFWLMVYKAGAISAMFMWGSACIALMWAAFREYEELMVPLTVISCVGALSFGIAAVIFDKKM